MVNIVRPIYSRYTKVYTKVYAKVYIFNFVNNGVATDRVLEQYRGCTIRVVYTIRVVQGTLHHKKINKACNGEKMWYNNNVH